jgi:hypothetical protein
MQRPYLPERVGHLVDGPAHAPPLGEVRRVQNDVLFEVALQGPGKPMASSVLRFSLLTSGSESP